MNTHKYIEHELASIFPMMVEADLKELAKDIKENGQRAPITLLENKILDGRNRYQACKLIGIEPRFKDYNGNGDPLAFVISANVHRRHLTESQRAMVAAKLATMRHGGNRRGDQAANLPLEKTEAEVAKELKVSPRTVRTAKKVLKEAKPETIKAIESGEKTVSAAAKEIKAKAEKAKVPNEPKEQLDKTGYPIPESILFDYERASDTSKQLLSKISSIRSEIKNALEQQDLIFAEVKNPVLADLNNAYTSVKCVVPYAVCTSCQGHQRKKCSLCRGRGFISEFAWRSFVPAEIKAIRGGKK